jgi:hypothetical protein
MLEFQLFVPRFFIKISLLWGPLLTQRVSETGGKGIPKIGWLYGKLYYYKCPMLRTWVRVQPLPPTNNNNRKEKKPLPKDLEMKAAQKESVQETHGSQILCTPLALTFHASNRPVWRATWSPLVEHPTSEGWMLRSGVTKQFSVGFQFPISNHHSG